MKDRIEKEKKNWLREHSNTMIMIWLWKDSHAIGEPKPKNSKSVRRKRNFMIHFNKIIGQ